jgi:hypothetical protein
MNSVSARCSLARDQRIRILRVICPLFSQNVLLLARNGSSGDGWMLPSMSIARDVSARHQIRPPCACPTPSSGYAASRGENYNRGHALWYSRPDLIQEQTMLCVAVRTD